MQMVIDVVIMCVYNVVLDGEQEGVGNAVVDVSDIAEQADVITLSTAVVVGETTPT